MFEITDARRDELVERWAQEIVRRRLATPAIFLLEAHKPLGGLGANAVVAFQPLLGSFLRWNLEELAAFMYHSANIEKLIRRIETLEEGRAAP
jgi:hypothetical protein